jgi:hypothetical protein
MHYVLSLLHESALQLCNLYNRELNLLLIKGSQISGQTTKGSVDNARSNGWMCTVSIISTSGGMGVEVWWQLPAHHNL